MTNCTQGENVRTSNAVGGRYKLFIIAILEKKLFLADNLTVKPRFTDIAVCSVTEYSSDISLYRASPAQKRDVSIHGRGFVANSGPSKHIGCIRMASWRRPSFSTWFQARIFERIHV